MVLVERVDGENPLTLQDVYWDMQIIQVSCGKCGERHDPSILRAWAFSIFKSRELVGISQGHSQFILNLFWLKEGQRAPTKYYLKGTVAEHGHICVF